jgi:hypothetical protein
MSKLGDNIKTATDAAKNAGATAKRSAAAAVGKGKTVAAKGVQSSKAIAKKAGDTTAQLSLVALPLVPLSACCCQKRSAKQKRWARLAKS